MSDQPHVLVIEDDENLRKQMKWGLEKEYRILEAADRGQAQEVFRDHRPPVVTLDLGLPPDEEGVEEGFALLEEILTIDPAAKVIVITGRDEKEHALSAVGRGAYDFIAKPVALDDLRYILQRAAHVARLEKEYIDLQRRSSAGGFEEMLGASEQMTEIYEKIRKVATTDVPVLIIGESGTGKELAAQAIHNRSLRSGRPFVAINCGAIPENLLESELFGHEKGAFTGAHVQRPGRVERADGGTLFLDEIGDLPPALQVKLLRFLQDQRFERVGGRQVLQVDVRVLAATNRDLVRSIEDGSFREDLFYRLGVVTIKAPPLRERDGDVLLLANAFLQQYAGDEGGRPMTFTAAAVKALEAHPWPGNIREMENRIRRAVIMADGPRIKPEHLELTAAARAVRHLGRTLKEAREALERDLITQSMARNRDNLTRVAQELGISRPALYDLLKKLGISRESGS